MSFTLHYGGVGRAFVVSDTLDDGGDGEPPIPYDADALMQDVRAAVARGGDWHVLPLRNGDVITVWFGPGVPMYITEDDDDHQERTGIPSWAEVLDLDPTREPTAPRVAGRSIGPAPDA